MKAMAYVLLLIPYVVLLLSLAGESITLVRTLHILYLNEVVGLGPRHRRLGAAPAR
jgi:hypothetical protein